MRHRMDHKKFSRAIGPRLAMMRNLVTSFLESGRITTTITRAKELRRVAEKLITIAKKAKKVEGDSQEAGAMRLHYKREAMKILRKREAMTKLFDEIAPIFLERPGGYTRIAKLAHLRKGDSSQMAIIELVREEKEEAKPKKKARKKKQKTAAKGPVNF